MNSAALLALELRAGLPLALQRVRRSETAEAFAAELGDSLDGAVRVVSHPLEPPGEGVRVLDGRRFREEDFAAWDMERARLASAEHPLVILLDVATTRWLLQAAPHVASWASGVRLPVPSAVRVARSKDELAAGRRWLQRLLRDDPVFSARHHGMTIAIDLLTGKDFVPSPPTTALERARDNLDEGIVFVTRIDDDDLVP